MVDSSDTFPKLLFMNHHPKGGMGDKRNKRRVSCLAHFSNRQIKLTELHLGGEHAQLILKDKKDSRSVNPIFQSNVLTITKKRTSIHQKIEEIKHLLGSPTGFWNSAFDSNKLDLQIKEIQQTKNK